MLLTTIRAINDAGASTNPIHLDDAARRLGHRGGWVGGPTLLGYLARAAADRWGDAWLAGGGLDVRFRAPVYDGDELRLELTAAGSGDTDRADGAEASLVNADGVVCAVAGLRPPGPTPDFAPEPDVTPEPAHEDKPLVSLAAFAGDRPLTTIPFTPEPPVAGGPVPLEDLVGASIDIMYATFRPDGPRILTRIVTTHLAPVDPGSTLVARGHVSAAWERRGRTYATNSVLLSTADGDPVLHLANTTIWRMPS